MTGIETMLLGAPLLSATAGASTVGLLGAGGTLSLGAGSLMSGASVFSTLATGLSYASAASSLFGGIQESAFIKAQGEQQAHALEMSAREDEIGAKEEELRGKRESNDLMDTMMRTISAQRLAFASNGVDVNFGTPQSVERDTRKIAGLQMGVTREDAQIRALARRRGGYARQEERLNVLSSTKQKASSALTSGIGAAGGTIGDLISRRTARG